MFYDLLFRLNEMFCLLFLVFQQSKLDSREKKVVDTMVEADFSTTLWTFKGTEGRLENFENLTVVDLKI
jgi:hypothetical protein